MKRDEESREQMEDDNGEVVEAEGNAEDLVSNEEFDLINEEVIEEDFV